MSFQEVSFYYPESTTLVFNRLSLDLPAGVMSLAGQNGTGKSTLLLLAAGLVHPVEGTVYLHGLDTRSLQEERGRQRHVSFIYQNMEFETEGSVGKLLDYVYQNGFHERQDPQLISTLVKVCELDKALGKRTQELSKGDLQRVIVAFSLLYGSRIVMMDEPIFALEDHQKEKIMRFLVDYAHREGISIYYSVHELDISRRFSDHLLLFHKDSPPVLGPTQELFTRENVETAYQVPFTMLKRKESLYRRLLLERFGSEEDLGP